MAIHDTGKKRQVARAAILAPALAAVSGSQAAAQKSAGETTIVAVFGVTDTSNGIGQEIRFRTIFSSKPDWRIVCVRGNKYLTPELIGTADCLVVSRDAIPDPVDLFAGGTGVADSIIPGEPLWTDRIVDTIMENVTKRGMGLCTLNATVACGSRRFLDFLDVKEIMPHEIEPLWIKNVNPIHPVTQGVGKFFINADEQYGVIIKSPSTATLFETTAIHEKRQAIGGWALESGQGRIAGLLPGSTVDAYEAPEYRNILWRAVHWSMRRDIPAYPDAVNTLYN